MKPSLLALLLLSFNAQAASRLDGEFLSPSSTWYFSEKESCEKDGGNYEGVDEAPAKGICYVNVDDTLTVKNDGADYALDIITWGGNGHTCSFEGKATVMDGKLVAQEKIEDVGTCKITVTYTSENSVNVTTSEEGEHACRYFCGMRGPGLSIEKATRK